MSIVVVLRSVNVVVVDVVMKIYYGRCVLLDILVFVNEEIVLIIGVFN